jgi:hypothetical protein
VSPSSIRKNRLPSRTKWAIIRARIEQRPVMEITILVAYE